MSNFEYDARRLARDLDYGNTADAAQVLRQEIWQRPCETPALVNRAYQLSSPARRDDVYISGGGTVTVRERYTGYQEYAGTIPSYCGRPGNPYPYPNYPTPFPIPIPIPIPFPRRPGGDHHPHPHPGHPGGDHHPHPNPGHPRPGNPHPHPGDHRGGGHRR